MTRDVDKPDSLLRDLVQGLTGAQGDAQASGFGLVGPGREPHPPQNCLRACLEGSPAQLSTHGCRWLVAAAAGRLDTTCLHDGRCPKGFQVAAQPLTIEGRPAFLLSVRGKGGRGSSPDDLLQSGLAQLDAATRVVERVSQLLEENSGLADEVLRNYEQLNLIFDVTQQIAPITDVAEIERVLLHRVGELLGVSSIHIQHADGAWDSHALDGAAAPDAPAVRELREALDEDIQRVRRQRKVCVSSVGGASVMIGLLPRLDSRQDAVLALRPRGQPEFRAGEMLLMESVLSFGGQIISNSELHERLRRMSLEVTRALVSAIDKKDHYTCGHSERVGFLARLIGRQMGVPPADLQMLEWAGLLHDVGKIGVPEEVLNKQGRLTAEEFDQVKRHTIMGYEILKPIASFEGVLAGVLYHHENPDGTGYPEGLRDGQIPLPARIIHVADVFDALSSNRSYRPAFSIEQACEIIRTGSGTKFDPAVTEAFLKALAEFRAAHPSQFDALYRADQQPRHAQAAVVAEGCPSAGASGRGCCEPAGLAAPSLAGSRPGTGRGRPEENGRGPQ